VAKVIKSVPFELFAKGETLYFDISRLFQLEELTGKSIKYIFFEQEAALGFCAQALTIGLKHHYPEAGFLAWKGKIGQYIDEGGVLTDIWQPIQMAIGRTGVFVKLDEEGNGKGAERKNA
jgi:hypothetical protein